MPSQIKKKNGTKMQHGIHGETIGSEECYMH